MSRICPSESVENLSPKEATPGQNVVEYRVAQVGDALCVGVLAQQVFLDTYATDGLRADLAREALANYSPLAFEARIGAASNHFMLAEREGNLLAFSECSRSGKPPMSFLSAGVELVRLYVQRHAQRVGIGADLLAQAEIYAKDSGADLLWLAAWVGNTKAQAFYLAQGYQEVGASNHVFEGQAYVNRIYYKAF